MIITTAKELRQLTSSYYASNDFDRIQTDVELQTEELKRLISDAVYNKAQAEYIAPTTETSLPVQPELVRHVQLPIAIMSNYHYMQGNLVTHSDNGRKVKVNSDGERMAWEWMINADNRAMLRKAQVATDRLLNYLEKEAISEWISSDQRKEARRLFVNSTEMFQKVFPIDQSPRFYYTVTPFLTTIQETQVKPAMGEDYDTLLTEWQNNSVSDENKPIVALIQQAMPLLTMAMAARRLSLQVLPDSVVQNFRSQSETLSASKNALEETIKRFRLDILDEGLEALDKAKQLRTGDNTEPIYLPDNDECNKYMRT